MRMYRLFMLDESDALVGGVDLRSDCDREALGWAAFMLQSHFAGELWCGTRYVGPIQSVRSPESIFAPQDWPQQSIAA
jgi:hypothetical protein